jgi:hypothetical protein
MTEKFDPAPFDKHAANPKEAIKADIIIDENSEKVSSVARFLLQIPSALRNRHLQSTMKAMNDRHSRLAFLRSTNCKQGNIFAK